MSAFSARRLRDVLSNQVAIGIDEHEARGAGGGFVGGGGEGEAAGLEGPLDLADVVKAGKWIGVAVPAWIKSCVHPIGAGPGRETAAKQARTLASTSGTP